MTATLGALAHPTTCGRCDTTRYAARPNWGTAWLCQSCKADAVNTMWNERARRGELDPEELKALRRIERLIAAHEATLEPEQLDMFAA